MTTQKESQLATAVLMIRPARFESNPLTAASNRFQHAQDISVEAQQEAAVSQFDDLRRLLQDNGIQVVCIEDTFEPHTPDSIFPNNWISFHADGTVVLYPMEATNRRPERRDDIIDDLGSKYGFHVTRTIDLSAHELDGRYLEGTGSMVLDRANRIAYACLSSRTHLDVLGDFAQQLDYEVLAFDATDRTGVPIYHTNVLMNIGETLAIICADALPRDEQKMAVLTSLQKTGHTVLSISPAQMEAFAGNMLELRNAHGERLLAMSEQVSDSLTKKQRETVEAHSKVISVPIDDIENSAGGSVRCMLAEIHLPKM